VICEKQAWGAALGNEIDHESEAGAACECRGGLTDRATGKCQRGRGALTSSRKKYGATWESLCCQKGRVFVSGKKGVTMGGAQPKNQTHPTRPNDGRIRQGGYSLNGGKKNKSVRGFGETRGKERKCAEVGDGPQKKLSAACAGAFDTSRGRDSLP